MIPDQQTFRPEPPSGQYVLLYTKESVWCISLKATNVILMVALVDKSGDHQSD